VQNLLRGIRADPFAKIGFEYAHLLDPFDGIRRGQLRGLPSVPGLPRSIALRPESRCILAPCTTGLYMPATVPPFTSHQRCRRRVVLVVPVARRPHGLRWLVTSNSAHLASPAIARGVATTFAGNPARSCPKSMCRRRSADLLAQTSTDVSATSVQLAVASLLPVSCLSPQPFGLSGATSLPLSTLSCSRCSVCMSPCRPSRVTSITCWNSRVLAQNERTLQDGFQAVNCFAHLSWVFPPSRD